MSYRKQTDTQARSGHALCSGAGLENGLGPLIQTLSISPWDCKCPTATERHDVEVVGQSETSRSRIAELRAFPCVWSASERVTPPPSAFFSMKLSAPIAGSSYRVTSTVGDFAEMILDPLGGHVTQERRVVLLLKGDHRDVGYVAFVSSPRMSDLAQLHAPDMSVDSIATVSFADLNTPPPPAGPFV